MSRSNLIEDIANCASTSEKNISQVLLIYERLGKESFAENVQNIQNLRDTDNNMNNISLREGSVALTTDLVHAEVDGFSK